MIKNWKRGALVGVASAAILTLGGGAAMAAGSHGSSPAADKATALAQTVNATGLAKSCGVVWAAPARPGSPSITKERLPSSVPAPVVQVWVVAPTSKVPPTARPVHLSCVVPLTGAKCVVAFRATAPRAPQVKALRGLPAKPGQKFATVAPMRTMAIPGCPPLQITACKATAGKTRVQTIKPAGRTQMTVRCGDMVKAKSAPAKP